MQIVVNIPDKTYDYFAQGLRYADDVEEAIIAIVDGIQLPKWHGRIGDLDALRDAVSSWGMNEEPSDFIDAIDEAPTIIEKDGENIKNA